MKTNTNRYGVKWFMHVEIDHNAMKNILFYVTNHICTKTQCLLNIELKDEIIYFRIILKVCFFE